MKHETEKGFGTGLRSKLERTQNGGSIEPEVVEPVAVVVSAPVDVIVQGTVPELDAMRGELQAALEREQILREETHAACRAVAERESQLESWTAELQEREEAIGRRSDELEREHRTLVDRHTEIVSEYARVQELSSHAESRVDELQGAERDRAEAAAEIAKQLASLSERERELKRERAAYDARQQEAESRLASRESTLRERDVTVAERERRVRDADTGAAGMRARLEARDQSLAANEARLTQEVAALEDQRAAVEATLDERARSVADGEAALQVWEQRLRAEAERMQDERTEHGVTSQDAFALMAELETRESALAKREAEVLDAQSRLQAASAVAPRDRDLDERETALVAREAELNRRLATAARDERDNDLVEQLRIELRKREDEVAAREQFFADRRERIEAREERLVFVERDLAEKTAQTERLEDDLRFQSARHEADLELREDKVDERLHDVEERERRLEQREADLSTYVISVQERFSAA